MTRKEGILFYSKILEDKLGITLTGNEYSFDKWGRADNHLILNANSILAVEIEMYQRHPEMNVLKIWPYLKDNSEKKVLLIQYLIDESSVSPNRVRLCRWLQSEMESGYSNRFKYHLIINSISEIEIESIKADINRFRSL